MDGRTILNTIASIIIGLSAGGFAGYGVARKKYLFVTLGILILVIGTALRKMIL